ncbi:MAG: DUF2147 domain-containing protein [Spirochaetia bacterium]|nr:DUF2147 domain-containing protein [Spirochaetia bacterium]
MKKKAIWTIILLLIMSSVGAVGERNIVGFWKTIDEKKGFITSIMMTYMYQGKLYGRVIVSFDEKSGEFVESYMNPTVVASKVKGTPLLLDIDIFYNLVLDEEKYVDGMVIDPRSGKSYHAEAWTTKEGFILRGKFGPFGMNNLFLPANRQDFPEGVEVPSFSSFTPYIW